MNSLLFFFPTSTYTHIQPGSTQGQSLANKEPPPAEHQMAQQQQESHGKGVGGGESNQKSPNDGRDYRQHLSQALKQHDALVFRPPGLPPSSLARPPVAEENSMNRSASLADLVVPPG